MTFEIDVHADAPATAAALVDALDALVAEVPAAHVGLTGGSMGVAVAQEIGRRWTAGSSDYGQVHWWFSDERFLSAGDSERNALQVREALGAAPVVGERFHEAPACPEGTQPDRAGAEAAATRYARELEIVPQQDGLPVLDVMVLGVGPDAHVASLFPGHPDSAAREGWTTAVDDSPKPPPVRVSFTLPVLRSAQQVWVVASGEGKAEALGDAVGHVAERAGRGVRPETDGPLDLPVSWATGRESTVWFLDEEAAGQLPR